VNVVRTAIMGATATESAQLDSCLGQFTAVNVVRRFPAYPENGELERFLRAGDPEVVFISTSNSVAMEQAITATTGTAPNVQIVLVDTRSSTMTLRVAMQLGVRECVTMPFELEDVRGAIERSVTRRAHLAMSQPASTNSLYSFLPARPGVGTSILATQTALHLALEQGKRGLLIEADLAAGMMPFLLQLNNPYSFVEALERVDQLDEHLWPQLVSEHGQIDIMLGGNSGPEYRADLSRLQYLLSFARRHYATILADLPSSIDHLSTEFMHQSKVVFLVTTLEVASLHMARKRYQELKDLQLEGQVRLIVNRVEKNAGLSMEDVANTVGLPVSTVFNNDYIEVQKAIMNGSRVASTRPLGRQLAEFAASLSASPAATSPPPKKRRFLEVFALAR
jgi:pilus assembly protein CpaE